MKKIQAFAVIMVVFFGSMSVLFAQTANTVQTMTGIRGVSLRTYCTFSTLFGAQNDKCFDANRIASINTASIGAVDLGTGTPPPTPPPTPAPSDTTPRTVTVGEFRVPVAPQIVERTVIVQGTPGLQGPAGRDGQSSFGSFTNVPQVFWAGGGGSSAPATTFVSSAPSFPTGGLPGQVLTLDASSTPAWAFSAMSTTSNATTSSLAWLLGGNSAVGTSSFIGTIDAEDFIIKTNSIERARIADNGNFTLFTNDQNPSSSMTVKGIHSDGRWGIFDEENNKLIQNRADQGILGFGTGDFVSYGFNSAMGIRGADVHIPHLVVGGNHTGPNNISQLRMESSSQTEYQYAGAYPNRVNSYIISTTLSAPLAPTDIRANMKIGARDLQFFTGANDSGIPALMVAENGNVGIGTTAPMRPLTVVADVGGTLALFKNTRPSGAAGASMIATRPDGTESARGGLFMYGQNNADDRMGLHFIGSGDVQTWDTAGNTFIGAPFASISAPLVAKLNVFGSSGTSPVGIVRSAINQIAPIFSFQTTAGTQTAWLDKDFDFHVPSEVFGLGWLGSSEVPTKGDIYSQLQLLASATATTSPAGVNGSVQFKKDGLFASNINFNWDDVLEGLTIGSNTSLVYPNFEPKLRITDGDILLSAGKNLVFDSVFQKSGMIWGDGNTSITNQSSSGIVQSVFGGLGGGDFELKSVALDTPENRLRFISSDAGFNPREGARISSVFTSRDMSSITGDLSFATNDGINLTEKMRLTSTGRLGIGTNAPTTKLDVQGTLGAELMFVNGMIRANSGGVINANGNTLFHTQGTGSTIVSADQNQFIINSNIGSNPNTAYVTGPAIRFGVGTNAPAWMLDVAGDASINGVRVGLGGGSILTNTVLGKEALMINTTGQRNVASGYRALFSNTGGDNNAAFGANTLALNTLGNSNVAFGISALFSNVTGNSNVAVGGGSLAKSQSGSHNVALGAQALDGILAGSGNIGIGYQAGSNITTGQNNIILGYQVNAVNPIANGQLNIGNLIFSQGINATGTILSTGNIGIGVQAPERKLHVAISTPGQVARFQNADGTCNINPSIFLAFNCLSDRNLKKDIAPLATSLALFSKLNPVNYHWNTEDSSSPLQYGFIAQDIEAIFPSFVTTDSETGIKSVAFGNLIPVTIKAVNELNVHLGDLSKESTPEVFSQSTIFKRFADAFKTVTVAFKNITADKATVKELCLPKSDGTVICLTGDQVAVIVESAGVASTETAAPVTTPAPVVPPTTLVVELPLVVNPSDSPVNGTPEVVVPVVETAPPAVEEVAPAPII